MYINKKDIEIKTQNACNLIEKCRLCAGEKFSFKTFPRNMLYNKIP